MAVLTHLKTDTGTNVDISAATAVGAYTSTGDKLVMCDVSIDAVAGNGDYVMYVTRQIGGSGSAYRILPQTTMTAASGLTAISAQSGWITVRNGDVLTCYVDGLAGDTSTPDWSTRWFESAVTLVTLADDAITASKFDESTAYPLKSPDSGSTAVARTGADSDTLETLSDQIDTIDSSGVAAAVWSNADRTLTQTATSITSAVSGSTITDVRGDSWDIDITDLTLDSNKQQFAIKRHAGDADSAALLFVDSDTGLLCINGAAGTASDASLVYAGTTLTLTVKPAATAQIPTGNHLYGIQSVTAAGVVNEAYGGTFTVQADVVKATA